MSKSETPGLAFYFVAVWHGIDQGVFDTQQDARWYLNAWADGEGEVEIVNRAEYLTRFEVEA